MQTKASLRQKALAFRASLDVTEITRRSEDAFSGLQDFVDWKTIKTLHIYPSRHDWHEIDTSLIVSHIREYHPNVHIEQPEPKASTPLPTTQFDLIIVPVVAYDAHNYRLGIGSGWYDKFLVNQTHAQTVGLAFKETRVASIPKEQHDIPLGKIIAV